ANIYLWIAKAIDAKRRGYEAFLKGHHYPGIEAGTEGVRWLENCVRSADAGSAWVEFK
ncbi:gfo/Idh/MocA family oxidoreductase, partial [Rhizobium ruizarguesonis]